MSDTPSLPFVNPTFSLCANLPRALQPEIYPSALKSVTISTFEQRSRDTILPAPQGWMHPTANSLPDGAIVLSPAHIAATVLPIRPATPPVVALPTELPPLPVCTTWGSHDGLTRGTVQRQDWGVTLMATTGVSGCRATASITLQADPARELAHVMLTVVAEALQERSKRYSVQWGDPKGLHGRVTLHAFGIDVTATNGGLDCCVATTMQFRDIHAVNEVGTLLFGQADAHDAESGEGDAA